MLVTLDADVLTLCENAVMARLLTLFNRTFVVIVAAVAGFAISIASIASAGTTTKSEPTPLMLIGVAGTPYTFVVSSYSVGCSHEPCLRLQRTSDDGKSFTTLHAPPLTFVSKNPLGNLRQLVFANEQDGYALLSSPNGTQLFPTYMYVTTDGARTWHRASVGRDDSILSVVATKGNLYADIAHCTNVNKCADYLLARSTLAAMKWTITAMPRLLRVTPYPNYHDMTAFGSDVWVTVVTMKSPLLFTSHDQGRTFTQSLAPKLGAVTACALTAESSSSLWAECPTGMMVSFFYSGDGGAQWTTVNRYGYAGTGGGYFAPVSSSLAYLDYGQTGPSRPRNIFRITNAGRTSTPVGVLRCTGVGGLVFTDSQHGLAICDASYSTSSTYLARTSDGGATWSHATPYYTPV